MRALVPVLMAASLAVAGWLATGIVTVRSLDSPDRIGLLPPVSVLLVLILVLLALSAIDRAGHSRVRSWRALAGVGLLTSPVVLPWLPGPWPPAALIWTGPLAFGWFLTCVACVYADAFARVFASARASLASPRRAPWIAAFATGGMLALAAWHTAPQHPRGDEPDYLIITQSLLLDGDLRIENNHQRADYTSYHPDPLPPSYLQRGTDGAIYSVHAPGLSVLLAPGFALAGHAGAVATLVLLAMAGAWFAWGAAWLASRDAVASWAGTAATVGAAPYFLHAPTVFPDAPASTLAVFVVWALLRPRPAERARSPVGLAVATALALGVLPWLHTRYAVIAVGLGVHCLWRFSPRGRAAFVMTGTACAVAWFGFFWAVYGTPSPSAPYGAYTQMALAHLRPGIPGLLFDQQFGLLASAPVLALAALSVRPSLRRTSPDAWPISLVMVALAIAYTCLVGAYRMWWGGLSAPARFLVPVVLPLAPLIALAWRSLRTQASRYLAVGALCASLAFTTVLVMVDDGALAYNVRDGRALWAVWAGPLVDLVAALPAAHRDAPAVVVRDAFVWVSLLVGLWGVWRVLERRGYLTRVGALGLTAIGVMLAAHVTWSLRGVPGLQPSLSQVQYLERRAQSAGDALITISPLPIGRTRTWFDVEIDSRRPAARGDFTALRVDRLPAGTYRLMTTASVPGARLGVTLGDTRAERFLAEIATPASSAPFTLAVPAVGVVVKASPEAMPGEGRTWLVADQVRSMPGVAPASRAHVMGDALWLLPDRGVYPEPGGLWLAGDADVTMGLPDEASIDVSMQAGAAAIDLEISGRRAERLTLAAGETRVVTLSPERGRVRVRTRGGFRPSLLGGSGDARLLAVWIGPAQNRTAPMK